MEADHCLAEARRMAQLAAQEANMEKLKATGEEVRRLSSSVRLFRVTTLLNNHRDLIEFQLLTVISMCGSAVQCYGRLRFLVGICKFLPYEI